MTVTMTNSRTILTTLSIILLFFSRGVYSQQPDPIDAIHYDFTISLPVSGKSISGNARIDVRRYYQADSVALNLIDLRVDSVLVDGTRCDFSYDKSIIQIPLPPHTTSPWDTVHLQIVYNGIVHDGLVIRPDDRGRWSAFGDNWPERARFWIPCVDRPNDKATVTWRVIAPTDRTVVANGEFLEKVGLPDSSGNKYSLTVWKESHPISTYLMVIAVGTLAKYSLPASPTSSGGRVPVQQSVYVQPEVLDFLPGPFRCANDIVGYFSSIIAPFPYEKLAHVQSSTRYGGMENASAIFYADRGFQNRTMGPGVIAHETAHQWFGDAVTEKEWSHLWLSEGFATYFQELWDQHEFGDSTFKAEMMRTREEIIRSKVVRERPVIDTLQTDPMRLLDVNSYQKGAWVLHMLRSTLGDSVFYSSLRSYYAKYRDGNALTDDLEQEFENASHKHLRWFFDQWLRRPGFATVSSSWTYDEQSKQVHLTVEQSGDFPPYRFPLTCAVVTTAGKLVRERFTVEALPRDSLTFDHSFEKSPREVVLDPDVELLARFLPD